ncbi:MAG: PQQ-binding-like beta-propeller repeat protein [Pirellulales bacterium]
MKTWCLLLIGVGLGIFSLAAGAADWPQWRGPLRNGISGETGLLREWPAGGPKLVWQVTQIGSGYSTPAVVGDRLYLLSNEGTDDEFVQALDAKDGSQVWSTRIGKVGNPDQNPPYPGARSTPTVDGKLMYALGSDGDLACLETSSGQIQWQENLRTQFDGQPGVWAYAESPLVDGDVLVCTPGGAEATMVALDKNTGDLIWKCAVPGGDQAGYASIVIVESGGVKQYVQFMQKGLVGVDAASGEFLWRYDRTAEGSPANIPTPVARDGYVYSAAGRSGGGLVKLNVDQAKVEAQEVYFDPKLPTSLGGAVLVGDHLYGTTGQGLVCADFITGEVKWQDRGIGPGSLCYADGRLYIHGENGDVALVEATPEAYRELGRFTLPDQPDRGRSRAWSHPVIANGRLIIRDLDTLWMYDIQGKH